jgi:general nucleoside transport system permease protein
MLWGAIPGMLKAFTGANEVVVTIMMNYIAALFIDFLIKADPPIMRDPSQSVPKTPLIQEAARLPHFGELPFWSFILAGVIVFALVFLTSQIFKGNAKRNSQQSRNLLIRGIVLGVVTVVAGVFLQWVSVTDRLHVGIFIMMLVVFGTDWFLNRTIGGLELRTVGMNPFAAKYAGMSVALNVVLAMAISGGLAGFAGAIQISGSEFAMVPNLFAGFGFDSISVALLARKNPRNMIWSGLLWGGLLSAAGLMQIRADVSIDLVRIIQALIIMFVAADEIIRFIYRIPQNKDDNKLIFTR